MTNDAPFTELPSPPRSPNQPAKEADLRGNDFAISVVDDEYQRATAYRDHIVAISLNHRDVILNKLKGNKDAYRSLQHKVLALTRAAPPYIDSP